MRSPALHQPTLDQVLFFQEGTPYSGRVSQRYRFPAVEVQSTDARWEGSRILYLSNSVVFVSPDWLAGKLTIYGIQAELSSHHLSQQEIVTLLIQQEMLQRHYLPQKRHIY